MCGQRTRVTGLPCARKTGGATACFSHTNQDRRHLVQLNRLNETEWAVHTTLRFLILPPAPDPVPDGEPVASYTVPAGVPIKGLYAVCNTHHIFVLRPGDRIVACIRSNRRYIHALLKMDGNLTVKVGPVAFLAFNLPLKPPTTWSQRLETLKQWAKHRVLHIPLPLPNWVKQLDTTIE
jgi:hypothetical protein